MSQGKAAKETALGPVVGLVARNSVDYVRQFHRLALEGKVVVPLRSKDDAYRIQACGIRTIVEPEADSGWLQGDIAWPDGPRIAQVAFTSGTEGEPKGILLTDANLASTVGRLQAIMRMDASIREYVGVPVYHSFGFARCRAALAAGGRAYIPDSGFSIPELVRMLQDGEVNAVSTVPSLWRVVLKFRDNFEGVGRKVRWIEIGSQPMSGAEKAAMRALFPEAIIVQHYGLTEASRATFLDVGAATREELNSVGRPNGDVEVDIGTEGRIRIRGSNVAREMLREGRRVPLVDDAGWLTTNDLGELREGNLCYLGRADDVINIGGIKVAPEVLEGSMARALGVSEDFCVVRVPDELRGDGVLIAAVKRQTLSDEALVGAASQALLEMGVDARSSLSVLRLKSLPTTDSGKVKRKEIAQHHLQKAKPAAQADRPPAAGASRVDELLSIYASVFPSANIRTRDSFVSLGGDSLSFVELSTALEGALGRLPAGWEKLSIEKLAGEATPRSWLHAMDLSVALRAIAIVAIVVGHFDWVDLQGGAFLLLVVAGFNFARFQLGGVVESGSVRSILRLAWNIALPTIAAMVILSARKLTVDVPGLLLVKNWVSVDISAVDYWFLEILVQILLVVALLFSHRGVRTFSGRHPFGLALGLFLVALLMVGLVPRIWSTEHVFNRVPHMLVWLFFLGWAARCARTLPERALVVLLGLIGSAIAWAEPRYWIGYAAYWVVAGTILLLSIETVRVPWPLNRIASIVAAASLFIYITHMPLRGVWQKLGFEASPPLEVIIALLLGVTVHAAWQRLMARVTWIVPGRRSSTPEVHERIL